MRNADIKYKVESIINILDEWMERIDNETDPEDDFKQDETVSKMPEMLYPYQAGVWKARAGMNADKLRRAKFWLLNEFKDVGVQPRVSK